MKLTVKAARVNCGKKSKDVADSLGLSVTGYSKKENGHARFYVDEIVKLGQLLDVPFENFFEVECHKKTQNNKGGVM
ncbi:helix-turn-helix domain-containing protein [Paenibacillus oenotherae]|uniref:Helix-turn-helix domain-containing protein n=1 Tax=Paenibacillus oenotherae TaxID=1435645 RepID=A0ABS7D7X2_9BACL|nr:helix-turn-helix domain-containing protein [Paenibacillus oenotherae]